jgi:hypothetical protein
MSDIANGSSGHSASLCLVYQYIQCIIISDVMILLKFFRSNKVDSSYSLVTKLSFSGIVL